MRCWSPLRTVLWHGSLPPTLRLTLATWTVRNPVAQSTHPPGHSYSTSAAKMTSTGTTTLPFDPALTSTSAYTTLITSLKPTSPPLTTTSPSSTSSIVSSNPFYNAMRVPELQIHESTLNPTTTTSNLMLTDNLGITNESTLSPTLDLFNELSSEREEGFEQLFAKAWEEDSLLTLKIIFSTRSIPRGKGEKEAFTRGAAFLAEHHPQTLLRNLEELVRPSDLIPKPKKRKAESVLPREGEEEEEVDLCEVEEKAEEDVELTAATARSTGYFKDLLNLLTLSSLASSTTPTGSQLAISGDYSRLPGFKVIDSSPYATSRTHFKKRKSSKKEKVEDDDATVVEDTSLTKEERKAHEATRLVQLLSTEGGFHRALHTTVARIFGNQLKEDLKTLNSAKELRAAGKDDEARDVEKRISLAAKWAPTEGASHDKATRIASSIAEYLSPPPSPSSPRTKEYTVRSLSIYRQQYLVPLRKHLEIVERRMSSNEWTSIKYSRVSSIAMNKYKKHFIKHDPQGFTSYLVDVAQGKATISGATLTPAVLAKQAVRETGPLAEVVQTQWNTLVQSIRDSGTLSNCLAIADVSGSMTYPQLSLDSTTPIDSSVALAILVSEVTLPPFANSVISFSEQPHFIDFDQGMKLGEKIELIQRKGMGYNTDFALVMRTILKRAKENQLKPEEMIKRLFIFSDMEFDSAQAGFQNRYETHHTLLKHEYSLSGYPFPEMIYWNLAARPSGPTSKPVTSNEQGTALVSGYSAALLKVFLDGGDFEEAEEGEGGWEEVESVGEDGEVVVRKEKGGIDPLSVLRKATGHVSFEGLKVFD